MSDEREESIRRRAYELWEQGGGDHGRDQDHWHQAAGEIGAAVAPDGTTIGNGADTGGDADGSSAAEGDGGNGASIVEAEVTTPATPAGAAVKAAPKARKPKTTK
jgi:hypothetical protein